MRRLFTSESVGPGHPDKICDQVSDAILDECLRRDPKAHVAVECFITTQLLVIGGEVSGNIGEIDYEGIARNVIKNIGYDDESKGFDYKTAKINIVVQTQSADIALGVDKSDKEIGAGDQGLMFGFACKETKDFMPLPIYLSHELVKRADKLRKDGTFKYALPDMKSQVTVDYTDFDNPKIITVVLSVQHKEEADLDEFRKWIKANIIDIVMKENGLNTDYNVLINPTGRFVIGGPHGDTGLTGRKIIVDTYGGYAPHGGGAFSGKDPTKVDRSACYMARYVAKNLVAAGYSDKLQIQLSYAIGVAKPTSVSFKTFHTAHVNDDVIGDAIENFFDLTPKGIIDTLNLRKPIYGPTAAFGHFGRSDLDLPWERLDKVEELKEYLKKVGNN